MLNPALNRQALTRRALVATTVALLGITLPIAAFRAAAQNAPLMLSGTVYDASGAVLPGVNLTLEDAQQVKSQATTDSSGRFEFVSIGPGRYVLNASLAGFRSLRHEFEPPARPRVDVRRHDKLPAVIQATGTTRALLRAAQRRQQQAGQDHDDGDDHQQLNQRERSLAEAPLRY